MKASEIIHQLSGFIGEAGEDVEIQFVLDVENWHPPLTLHLFEVDGALPEKYGVTFRFTARGQHAQQTNEGYRFQEIAARAWANREASKYYTSTPRSLVTYSPTR